jgi:Uma2 family endonuclease
MSLPAVELHRFTRGEYQRMGAAGLFPTRVELVEGAIYDMSPQKSAHAVVVSLAEAALRSAFGTGSYVRVQMPLALGDDSEPEPDVAVILGSPRDYLAEHPRAALVVVEVADASLRQDRGQKLPLYARFGIPEAVLIDLPGQAVELHCDPSPEGYRSRTVLRRGDTLSLLSCPTARSAVADLLP